MRDAGHEALADLVETVEARVFGIHTNRELRASLDNAKWTLAARGYEWSMHERKFIRRPPGEVAPAPGASRGV